MLPVDSSDYRAIIGRRWSSILEPCPAHRRWHFNWHGFNAGDLDLLQDFNVLRVNVEDGAETALVKALEEMNVTAVGD